MVRSNRRRCRATEPVLSHQPGGPTRTDGEAGILQLARYAGVATGPVRECEGSTDMGKKHEVVARPLAGGAAAPGEIAAGSHQEPCTGAGWKLIVPSIPELEPSSTSLLGEESGRPLQDLPILVQHLALAPQPLQLGGHVIRSKSIAPGAPVRRSALCQGVRIANMNYARVNRAACEPLIQFTLSGHQG